MGGIHEVAALLHIEVHHPKRLFARRARAERPRAEAQRALARAGWIPFVGTRDELRALDEDRRLEILREAVRSAQIRASAAPAAP